MAGAYDMVVACGVESMSRVPMGTAMHRRRTRSARRSPPGSPKALIAQGISAELIAAEWRLTRDELDEFSARSHRLAAASTEAGAFAAEIVPVIAVPGRRRAA